MRTVVVFGNRIEESNARLKEDFDKAIKIGIVNHFELDDDSNVISYTTKHDVKMVSVLARNGCYTQKIDGAIISCNIPENIVKGVIFPLIRKDGFNFIY